MSHANSWASWSSSDMYASGYMPSLKQHTGGGGWRCPGLCHICMHLSIYVYMTAHIYCVRSKKPAEAFSTPLWAIGPSLDTTLAVSADEDRRGSPAARLAHALQQLPSLTLSLQQRSPFFPQELGRRAWSATSSHQHLLPYIYIYNYINTLLMNRNQDLLLIM